MSQVELIVEVKCSFSEGRNNVLVEGKSGSDDQRRQLLEGRFESLEMSLEEGGVDEEE
jgi:hypothetical protein